MLLDILFKFYDMVNIFAAAFNSLVMFHCIYYNMFILLFLTIQQTSF
jgi:hypothetical protein